MSKYPNHKGYIRLLTTDILSAINMAVFGNAHIWSQTQLKSINAAFMSGHVAKTSPFYEPEDEDDEKERKERKVLEYKP